MALCLHIISNKTSTPNSWLAWIPIANIYLICKIADKPGWWTLLLLIPPFNIVFYVIVWMEIAKALQLPSWLGFIMVIPYLGVILVGVLAFAGKRVNE